MKKFFAIFFIVTAVFVYGQDFKNTAWYFSIITLDGKITTRGEMVFGEIGTASINGSKHSYHITDDKIIFIDTLGYYIKQVNDKVIELSPAFGGEQYIVKLNRK